MVTMEIYFETVVDGFDVSPAVARISNVTCQEELHRFLCPNFGDADVSTGRMFFYGGDALAKILISQ